MLNPHAPVFSPSKPRPVQAYTGSFLKPLRPSKGSKQYREEQINVVRNRHMSSGGYESASSHHHTPHHFAVGHQKYHTMPHSMSLPSVAGYNQSNHSPPHDADALANSFQDMSLNGVSVPLSSTGGTAASTVPPPSITTAASSAVSNVALASSDFRLPPSLQLSRLGLPATNGPVMSHSHPTSPRSTPFRTRSAHTTPPQQSVSQPLSPQQQVCKYYLMGECKIINCPFLHSTESPSAVCRYWQWGNCRRGDQCRFLHRNIDGSGTSSGAIGATNTSSSTSLPSSSSQPSQQQPFPSQQNPQTRPFVQQQQQQQQSATAPLAHHVTPQQQQRLGGVPLLSTSSSNGAFGHRNLTAVPPHNDVLLVEEKRRKLDGDDDNGDELLSQIATAAIAGNALENGPLMSSSLNQPFDLNKAFPPFESTSTIPQAPVHGTSTSIASGTPSFRTNPGPTSSNTSILTAKTLPLSTLSGLSLDFLSPAALTRSQSSPADVQQAMSASTNTGGVVPGRPPPPSSQEIYPKPHSDSSSPNSAPTPSLSLFEFSDTMFGTSLATATSTKSTQLANGVGLVSGSTQSVSAGGVTPFSTVVGNMHANVGVRQATPDLSNSVAFPPIGAASSSSFDGTANGGGHQTQATSYMDLASRFKLEDLQKRHFPHVRPNEVETTFRSHRCNFKNTEQALLKQFGPIPKSLKSNVQSGPKLPAPIPHPSMKYTKEGPAVKKNTWVATGNEVGILYDQYRAEAVDHAVQRNALFQKAADAYLRGDGKLAREFSDRGRFHDEAMHAGHAKAARVIFESRNKNNKVSSDGHLTLDLHGLHRTEATDILDEKLSELMQNHFAVKQQQGGGSVRVTRVKTVDLLLGTGHHSTAGKPILLPAILEFLTSRKYAHREVSHGGRGGAVRVLLERSVNTCQTTRPVSASS